MIPLEEAQRRVDAACTVLAPVPVPRAEALGLVVAEPVVATELVPPFDNTAMDGFAVRAADTAGAPVDLEIIGTLAAGAAPTAAVGPGQALRIMTGAPMPEGADAIVMVERTSAAADGRTVRIDVTVPVGEHVRVAGDDLRPGMVVIEAGTALRPGHLGVLASLGIDTVTAHRRARVGVLSTGDEIIESGPLAPGQIRDSNRPTLLSLAIDAGCEPVDLGRAPDDADAIRAAIDEGVRTCDALLSSGGVSMGDFDYVKAVLGDVSGDMAWMQVAIRPAKPFAFGTLPAPDGRHIPVFGLPGNPVSSMVSFELFARPALRKMMGHRSTDRPRVEAVADEPVRRGPDGKIHFARVVCGYGEDGRFHIRSAGGQGSHQLGAMAVANALAVVPDGDGVEAGGTVTVMLLDTSWSAPAGGR